MALSARFKDALRAGRQAVAEGDNIRLADDAPPMPDAAAALALGPDCDTAHVLPILRARGEIAFLISGSHDLAQYQEPGLITEFLPLSDDWDSSPDGAARLNYAARRLLVMCEKWRVGVLYPLGPTSAAGLAGMRAVMPRLPVSDMKDWVGK